MLNKGRKLTNLLIKYMSCEATLICVRGLYRNKALFRYDFQFIAKQVNGSTTFLLCFTRHVSYQIKG